MHVAHPDSSSGHRLPASDSSCWAESRLHGKCLVPEWWQSLPPPAAVCLEALGPSHTLVEGERVNADLFRKHFPPTSQPPPFVDDL